MLRGAVVTSGRGRDWVASGRRKRRRDGCEGVGWSVRHSAATSLHAPPPARTQPRRQQQQLLRASSSSATATSERWSVEAALFLLSFSSAFYTVRIRLPADDTRPPHPCGALLLHRSCPVKHTGQSQHLPRSKGKHSRLRRESKTASLSAMSGAAVA